MNSLVKNIAVASAVSLMAIGSAGAVSAQSKDNDIRVETNKKWKFDSNRHERRRHKDDRFRFHFGGFWYPSPYWLGYGLVVNPRLSCAEGRAIVDVRFNRVRAIECRGATYTYLGRRHGDDFKVMLNARTGRIVDVDRV
jgi:hypothetical protein